MYFVGEVHCVFFVACLHLFWKLVILSPSRLIWCHLTVIETLVFSVHNIGHQFVHCYSTKFHTYAFVPWPNPFPMLAIIFPKSHLSKSSKKHALRAYLWVSLVQHMDIHAFPHCNPRMPSFLVKNKIIMCFRVGFWLGSFPNDPLPVHNRIQLPKPLWEDIKQP
jgi:hypothetical protein